LGGEIRKGGEVDSARSLGGRERDVCLDEEDS